MLNAAFRRLRLMPEYGTMLSLVVLILFFVCLNPKLLSPASLASILRTISFAGIIVIGQTLLVIGGELDLSVGSVASLGAISAGWLLKMHEWPMPAAVAAALLVGATIGLINGIVTVKAGVPAFIATLGMFYVARGGTFLISSGYPIYPLPKSLAAFGKSSPCGLSWAFFIFVVFATLTDQVMRRTVFGRWLYATGGNHAAAHLSGIPTTQLKLACYVFTGTLAALAGVLLMAQLGVGQPEIGIGWELETIASVVIGGVSLFGGTGTVLGAALGLLLIQIVRSGLVVGGVSTHWQTVATGVIIIVAVGIDQFRRRSDRSRYG